MLLPVALMLSLAAPAEQPKPQQPWHALRALQGKWEMIRAETKDEAGDLDEADRSILEFSGRRWIFDGRLKSLVVAIDPTTDPICLDTVSTESGKEEEAIYRVKGDTLTIAFFQGDGRQRPTSFERPRDSDTVVITFRRVRAK